MKKNIAILALTMLAMRLPSPIGVAQPTLATVYYSTNSTVTIYLTGAQSKRAITLQQSTDLTSTNWTSLMTNTVLSGGVFVWTNVPATNPQEYFRTVY
jgi:hypothetical protein